MTIRKPAKKRRSAGVTRAEFDSSIAQILKAVHGNTTVAASSAAQQVSSAADEAVQKIRDAAASAAVYDSAAKANVPIEKLIEATIVATFQRLGIDTNNPDQTRADFEAIRSWRETMHYVRRRGLGAFVWTVVVGTLTALGLGVSAYLKAPAVGG